MRDKAKLTQALLNSWPDDNPETFDRAMSLWWYNIRRNGGLRLTEVGYFVMHNVLEIESYRMAIDLDQFDRQMILDLDRKLQMPYYIEVKKKLPVNIVFFGSREAVLAQLYGSLKKFLQNYT